MKGKEGREKPKRRGRNIRVKKIRDGTIRGGEGRDRKERGSKGKKEGWESK